MENLKSLPIKESIIFIWKVLLCHPRFYQCVVFYFRYYHSFRFSRKFLLYLSLWVFPKRFRIIKIWLVSSSLSDLWYKVDTLKIILIVSLCQLKSLNKTSILLHPLPSPLSSSTSRSDFIWRTNQRRGRRDPMKDVKMDLLVPSDKEVSGRDLLISVNKEEEMTTWCRRVRVRKYWM